MNKARSAAYRVLQSGARFHAGNISKFDIGQRRGSLKDLKRDFSELCRRIKRQTGCKVEYFGTYVRDFKDEEWRRHAHFVWNSRITDWHVLKPMYEEIAGEQSSIFVNDKIEEHQYRLTYCLQYNARQKGESIRYAKSEGWLPIGYEQAWREIRGMKESHYSMWILDLNAWIDKQRGIYQDRSKQAKLLSGVPRRPCDVYYASLQVDRGFTKPQTGLEYRQSTKKAGWKARSEGIHTCIAGKATLRHERPFSDTGRIAQTVDSPKEKS
jgi:hypothetical protein